MAMGRFALKGQPWAWGVASVGCLVPVRAPLLRPRGPGLLFSAAALGPGAALKASAGGFMLPCSGILVF